MMWLVNNKGQLVLRTTYSINGSYGEIEIGISLNEILWELTMCYN